MHIIMNQILTRERPGAIMIKLNDSSRNLNETKQGKPLKKAPLKRTCNNYATRC